MVELIRSLGELVEAGGVEAFARAAAKRAADEERASWLPALEVLAARLTDEDDPLASAYLDGEIRRLRRRLRRLPAVPSPEAIERRRELTRARVRRHRERRRLKAAE
jgi:hypothetical protein